MQGLQVEQLLLLDSQLHKATGQAWISDAGQCRHVSRASRAVSTALSPSVPCLVSRLSARIQARYHGQHTPMQTDERCSSGSSWWTKSLAQARSRIAGVLGQMAHGHVSTRQGGVGRGPFRSAAGALHTCSRRLRSCSHTGHAPAWQAPAAQAAPSSINTIASNQARKRRGSFSLHSHPDQPASSPAFQARRYALTLTSQCWRERRGLPPC